MTKRLDSVFRFLKDEYILKDTGMTPIKVKDLLKYEIKKVKTLYDFNATLKSIGIKYKKSGNANYYKKTKDELNAIATKFQWMHDLDEMIEPTDKTQINKSAAYLDEGSRQLYEENETLKTEIQKLKNQLKSSKIAVNLTVDSDDDYIFEDNITEAIKSEPIPEPIPEPIVTKPKVVKKIEPKIEEPKSTVKKVVKKVVPIKIEPKSEPIKETVQIAQIKTTTTSLTNEQIAANKARIFNACLLDMDEDSDTIYEIGIPPRRK